jgi:hypothetical protein
VPTAVPEAVVDRVVELQGEVPLADREPQGPRQCPDDDDDGEVPAERCPSPCHHDGDATPSVGAGRSAASHPLATVGVMRGAGLTKDRGEVAACLSAYRSVSATPLHSSATGSSGGRRSRPTDRPRCASRSAPAARRRRVGSRQGVDAAAGRGDDGRSGSRFEFVDAHRR